MEALRLEADNMHVSLVRLIFVLIALMIIYHRHSRFSIPLYAVQMKPALMLHISVGLVELLGLYLQPMFLRHERIPNLLDLVLCFAQSGTNMALVKRMARGQWRMTRPSYQAGAIMRPILTISAMFFQRSDLHTSSLQIINAFIYTRCLIYIWSKTKLLDRHSDTYMVAVFAAAILAMADTPCPAILSKAYVLCVAGISLLNHWASEQILKSSTQKSKSKAHLLALLLRLGLVNLPTLKEKELPVMIDDDYCDNLVPDETKSKSPTTAQEAADPSSQIFDDDKIKNQSQMTTQMLTTEISSADDSCLKSWTKTEVLVSETQKSSKHSQVVTMTYSPISIEDKTSTSMTLDSGDIVAEMDRPPSVHNVALVNNLSRIKRWRSALSLRGISTSVALRDTEDVSKTLKLGPRVLVNEIKAFDDESISHEITHPRKQSKSKRVLMYRMLEKFKKEKQQTAVH